MTPSASFPGAMNTRRNDFAYIMRYRQIRRIAPFSPPLPTGYHLRNEEKARNRCKGFQTSSSLRKLLFLGLHLRTAVFETGRRVLRILYLWTECGISRLPFQGAHNRGKMEMSRQARIRRADVDRVALGCLCRVIACVFLWTNGMSRTSASLLERLERRRQPGCLAAVRSALYALDLSLGLAGRIGRERSLRPGARRFPDPGGKTAASSNTTASGVFGPG